MVETDDRVRLKNEIIEAVEDSRVVPHHAALNPFGKSG